MPPTCRRLLQAACRQPAPHWPLPEVANPQPPPAAAGMPCRSFPQPPSSPPPLLSVISGLEGKKKAITLSQNVLLRPNKHKLRLLLQILMITYLTWGTALSLPFFHIPLLGISRSGRNTITCSATKSVKCKRIRQHRNGPFGFGFCPSTSGFRLTPASECLPRSEYHPNELSYIWDQRISSNM